ncbi:alpha-(1,3)-fucosyltransferase C-like [Maniola hyperantus]|uniref:alpha-(1,3)-fucosyltransferase C-like n=1 Tax=Aphantopus hyperantus TaxID=2795564 RepID=UPI001568AF30|nr:alpha-(1,3)-fucosyltransferase C-like [Maniola hyperantus]
MKKSYKKITITRVDRFVADMKHILSWTKINGLTDEGQKYFIKNKCKFINCYLTSNKNLLGDLRYFDVILFNVQDVSEETQPLPDVRSSTQKYMFVATDSSDNYPVCNPLYDDFFNWTWSYRYDSTISYRFITIYNTHYQELGSHFQWNYNMKPIDDAIKTQLASKSKAAVIFMDKCSTRSRREHLIQSMQSSLKKYNLTIDIFGKCGPKQCKRKNMNPCFWRLRKNYYFYLAFEDSIAYDYITDIVLNAYKNNAVPIVYGGVSYKRYLPPGSYLDVRNTTVEALVATMYESIKNREKYYDFFRWRNHYSIVKAPGMDPCVLCELLNNPARLVQKVSYDHFRKWWNPLYEKRCEVDMNKFLIL